MRPRRGPAFITVAALLALVALAGCGNKDFKNSPKPAVPIEATLEITSQKVDLSPSTFGAGLVNFVIANNSDQDASLAVKGPVNGDSVKIPNNGNGVFKLDMKQGEYEIGVADSDSIAPVHVKVGAPRSPSNNDLLLP